MSFFLILIVNALSSFLYSSWLKPFETTRTFFVVFTVQMPASTSRCFSTLADFSSNISQRKLSAAKEALQLRNCEERHTKRNGNCFIPSQPCPILCNLIFRAMIILTSGYAQLGLLLLDYINQT